MRERGPGAVRARISPKHVKFAADDRGEGANRRSAATPDALRKARSASTLIRVRGSSIVAVTASNLSVVGPNLDGDRPLAGRGRNDFRVQSLGDPPIQAEAVETGARQDESIRLPRVEPAKPRVDVAVQRMDTEIGPPRKQETRPPGAVGPDSGTPREVG